VSEGLVLNSLKWYGEAFPVSLYAFWGGPHFGSKGENWSDHCSVVFGLLQ
jgi:hypothetical protein